MMRARAKVVVARLMSDSMTKMSSYDSGSSDNTEWFEPIVFGLCYRDKSLLR